MKENTLNKSMSLMILVSIAIFLSLTACSNNEHPTGEHPEGTTIAPEHPEHSSAKDALEHP